MAGIDGASDGDGVGLLKLVGPVSTVRAVESHEDDLTEVRNTSEQEAGGSL